MLKTLAPTALLSALLLTLSTSSLAHPGHDHGHWSSSAVHTLLVAAIVAIPAIAIWVYRNQHKKAVQRRKDKLRRRVQ